jgi:hypothetical protein
MGYLRGFCGRTLFASLCLAALAAHSLWADSLPDKGDAHVNSAFPSTNFATVPFLQIGATTRVYIQFELSRLPPQFVSSSLARATLVLWVNRVPAPGSIQVSEVSSSWDASTVTWNQQPTTGSAVATVSSGRGSQFIYIDVTASVHKWLTSPSANQGFVLEGVPQSTAVFLDSERSVTTSHGPVLQVELSTTAGPAGTPGAAGAPGAAGTAGPAGPAGENGAPGASGAAGVRGPTGPEGPEGFVGATGATGAPGVAGAAGIEGPTGPTGNTGPAGAASFSALLTATSDVTVTTISGGLSGDSAMMPLSGFTAAATTSTSPSTTGFTAVMQTFPGPASFGTIAMNIVLAADQTFSGTFTITATVYLAGLGSLFPSPSALTCSIEFSGFAPSGALNFCVGFAIINFDLGDIGYMVISATDSGLAAVSSGPMAVSVGIGPVLGFL